jgi:hypothetical protein
MRALIMGDGRVADLFLYRAMAMIIWVRRTGVGPMAAAE